MARALFHLILRLVIPIEVQSGDIHGGLRRHMVIDETGDTRREPDVDIMLQLVNAAQIGSLSRTAVALGIAIGQTPLTKQPKTFIIA